MVDTITLELDVPKCLTSADFVYKAKWGTNYQQNKNNEPKYSTHLLALWPEEAKEKWLYLPEVEYTDYPNPRAKIEKISRLRKYRITFSAPKLLYGNNIEEVTEEQFEEIVEALYERLQFLRLPTEVTMDDIRSAKVCRLDFSKNAMIAELVPIGLFCSMLERSKHSRRSKYVRIQYRRGEGYREYIKHRCVVVYDKLAEFSNTTKAPANAREEYFLAAYKSHFFQVPKLEVQIQNYQQLVLELQRFGLGRQDIIFRKVFSKELAHNVLMRYWRQLVDKLEPNPEIFSEGNMLAVFNNAVVNSKGKTPLRIFASFGIMLLAHFCGFDTIREVFCRVRGRQAWGRIEGLYEEPRLDQGLYTFISSIEKIIDNMEPLQFEEYNGVFGEED